MKTRIIVSVICVFGFVSMGLAGLGYWGESRIQSLENSGHASVFSKQTFAEDLVKFDSLGVHRSGTSGDVATTQWLEQEFKALGYRVRRESFPVSSWQIDEALLTLGNKTINVFPQFPVKPTAGQSITAGLRLWNAETKQDYSGKIVVVDTDFWDHRGDLASGDFHQRIMAVSDSGAAAIVIITRAGCGRYQALNAPLALPNWKVPVVLAGESDAATLLQGIAEKQTVSLRVSASAQTLDAFNVVAQIGPSSEPAIVVSTPQSGWFTTTSERGTGVAAFMALARWAATQNKHYIFYSNSGHERGNAGAHVAIKSAPKPEQVALWLHIGANAGALGVPPSEGAVKTRFVMTNWWQLPKTWALFRRHTGGLAWPLPLELGITAGELTEYHNAGYAAIGSFGASPWHHCPNDRLEQASVAATRELALSYAALLTELFSAD
jgi:hypothetical protein